MYKKTVELLRKKDYKALGKQSMTLKKTESMLWVL